MIVDLLGAMSWDPGFKGVLVVVVGVSVLMGSVALILGTNSGARLGFLVALTGLFGWFIVMGLIWSIYGIGYKGPAPSWKVLDVVQGEPAQSRVAKADSLPLPDKIADPVELRDGSKELLKEFPATGKDPVIGDLAAIDPELEASINQQVAPWKLLITTNRFTGETQATVAEALGPNGQKLFEDPSEYVVVQSFFTGGKQGRTDNSIVGRVAYKAKSAVSFFNPPFLVAVQLQEVIPQDTKVGQAPPLPVRNRDAPVITVVMERDRGALRQHSIVFTIVSMIIFGILASSLHRRDSRAAAQRAQAPFPAV